MKPHNYRGIAGLGPVDHNRYMQRIHAQRQARRDIQAELDALREEDAERRVNVVASAVAIMFMMAGLAAIAWFLFTGGQP